MKKANTAMSEPTIFDKLRAPLPADDIHFKIQVKTPKDHPTRALMVPYADARGVRARLNAVLRPENWQSEIIDSVNKPGLICRIGLRIYDEWVWKADVGGTTGEDGDGFKGAASDALKRAAASWGIGEHLYSVRPVWVGLDDRGEVLPEGREELRRLAGLIANSGLIEESELAPDEGPPESPQTTQDDGDGASGDEAVVNGKTALEQAISDLGKCKTTAALNDLWARIERDFKGTPDYGELFRAFCEIGPTLAMPKGSRRG